MFNKYPITMRLDIEKIKNLQPNEDALVDGGYVDQDLKVIYDYLKDQDSKPPAIQEYFNQNVDYDFEKFLEAYLKSNGVEVHLEYTPDGWLKITRQ